MRGKESQLKVEKVMWNLWSDGKKTLNSRNASSVSRHRISTGIRQKKHQILFKMKSPENECVTQTKQPPVWGMFIFSMSSSQSLSACCRWELPFNCVGTVTSRRAEDLTSNTKHMLFSCQLFTSALLD